METIGMIGTGAMGLALLERLKIAGIPDVVCYDVYGPALENARKLGFSTAASVAEVAGRATLIDVVVRTDQDMLDCMLGADGAIEAAPPGTLLLLHSSILPQTVKAVDAAARAKGVHTIDACMTGVPSTVRAGKLSFVVGGPERLVERARPHLLKMSQEVFHMGPIGTGAVGKLIKNMLGGAETLRGYRRDRFSGRTRLFNIQMHLKQEPRLNCNNPFFFTRRIAYCKRQFVICQIPKSSSNAIVPGV